ncbi:MAG: hypothetical protein Q7R49_01820 [Candidatus Daviesbacteria bacterium]|nr:hypothetical protein [Candidatus Daviesbacteria bacterium]
MLETLDGLNIGSLNIEEPRPENMFPGDVREWIHPSVRDLARDYARLHSPGRWNYIDQNNKALLIFFPDIFKVKLLSGKKIQEGTIDRIRTDTSGRNFLELLQHAANAKFLFPNQDLPDEARWALVKFFLHTDSAPFLSREYFNVAACTKILSSEKAQEFNIDNDEMWQEGLKLLEDSRNNKNWIFFFSLAADMKTVSAEKFKEFRITDGNWRGIKEDFEANSRISQGHYDFLGGATLSILTLQADEIRLSPKKVEVIMPQVQDSFKRLTPRLPEVRKF